MIRIVLAMLLVLLANPSRAEPLTVFAAASLKNAFDAIADAFETQSGSQVVVSYAGTSVLARQIEQGAPADVFLSAHPDWMTYARENGLVIEASIQTFASNHITVVEPTFAAASTSFDLTVPDDWLERLGDDGRLAIGLTSAVPAGIYASQALEALGLTEVLRPRLAETDNVRAALLLVARGETPLGIVYATDARAEERVRVVARIPAGTHAPIAYQAARTTGSNHPSTDALLDYLSGSAARTVLEEQGFRVQSGDQDHDGEARLE